MKVENKTNAMTEQKNLLVWRWQQTATYSRCTLAAAHSLRARIPQGVYSLSLGLTCEMQYICKGKDIHMDKAPDQLLCKHNLVTKYEGRKLTIKENKHYPISEGSGHDNGSPFTTDLSDPY